MAELADPRSIIHTAVLLVLRTLRTLTAKDVAYERVGLVASRYMRRAAAAARERERERMSESEQHAAAKSD